MEQSRVEGDRILIGFGKEVGPIEVTRCLVVECQILGDRLSVGYLEVALHLGDAVFELLVGIVDDAPIEVCQCVGVIGTDINQFGEIASDGTWVVVLGHRYHAQIKIGVGCFGMFAADFAKQ